MRAVLIMAFGFLVGVACVQVLRKDVELAVPADAERVTQSGSASAAVCSPSEHAMPVSNDTDGVAEPGGLQDWSYRFTSESPSFDEQRHAEILFEIGKQHVHERHPDLGMLLGGEQFEQLASLWADLKRQPEGRDFSRGASYLHSLGVHEFYVSSLDRDERQTLDGLRQQVAQELGEYAAQQLDYYVATLHTRKQLEPVRNALLRENVALSTDETEALVFAQATAAFEAWPQWQSMLVRPVNSADYEHAMQLIELEWRRVLGMMATQVPAQRLPALERALRSRARNRVTDVAEAKAGGWSVHDASR